MKITHPNGSEYIIYQVQASGRPIWNIRKPGEPKNDGGYYSLVSLLNLKGWSIWEAQTIAAEAGA